MKPVSIVLFFYILFMFMPNVTATENNAPSIEFFLQQGERQVLYDNGNIGLSMNLFNVEEDAEINLSVIYPADAPWVIEFHESFRDSFWYNELWIGANLVIDMNYFSLNDRFSITVKVEVVGYEDVAYDIVTIDARIVEYFSVTFTFDQFHEIRQIGNFYTIRYFHSPTNDSPTQLNLDSGVNTVIYNEVEKLISDILTSSTLAGFEETNAIFTLIDRNGNGRFNEFTIEHSFTFVVDEITGDRLTAKNAPFYIPANPWPWGWDDTPILDILPILYFDRFETITVTRGGQEISLDELGENSVLEVVFNWILWDEGYDNLDLQIRVVTERIDGRIWGRSSLDGYFFRPTLPDDPDRRGHSAAPAAYNQHLLGLSAFGTFYIDSFGKIAAFFPVFDVIKVFEFEESISVAVSVKYSEPRVLISTLYCVNGILKDIQIRRAEDVDAFDGYNKILSTWFQDIIAGDYVRAFLWTDLRSMTPVN